MVNEIFDITGIQLMERRLCGKFKDIIIGKDQ